MNRHFLIMTSSEENKAIHYLGEDESSDLTLLHGSLLNFPSAIVGLVYSYVPGMLFFCTHPSSILFITLSAEFLGILAGSFQLPFLPPESIFGDNLDKVVDGEVWFRREEEKEDDEDEDEEQEQEQEQEQENEVCCLNLNDMVRLPISSVLVLSSSLLLSFSACESDIEES